MRIGLVLVLVLLSLFAFYIARTLEEQRIERELEIAAVDRLVAVQRALDSQFVLQNAIAAFHHTAEVGLLEFQDFVRPLLQADSPLQAIGWAPLVAEASRDALELAARAEGLHEFMILERDAGGSLIPAQQRSAYAPVLYMEPIAGNEAAVGFDLLSEPVRRGVLESARDTDTLSTTHRLHLVQDRLARSGFLSARAVYRRGAVLDSVSERRAALIGFVTCVFWVDDLIEIGLADLRPGGVDMYFFDPADKTGAEAFYVHVSRTRNQQIDSARSIVDAAFSHQGELDVGGRSWQVLSLPAPGFLAARRGPLPWGLLIAGLAAALIIYLALALIERRNRQLHRKNAELESSEARVRLVVESMPAVLIALDDDGCVLAWNAEGERVTGYSAAEVMGTSAQFLFGNKNSTSNIGPPDSSGDYRDVESTLTAKDGSLREVAWTRLAEEIPIPGWASWQIGIDVTARNLMARESQDLLEQSLQRQKLESVGLLAGGIAHDFNNLLTVILGNASLAHERISSSDPARGALDGILQAAQRAALLTQQLLAYTGKGTFQTEPIDISELVREIGSLLQTAISKKVGLHFELGTNLPAVDADPAQMQQLVMNLVINGAEASGDDSGTVYVRTGTQQIDEHYLKSILPDAEIEPGLYLYLEVQDDGQGMDAEIQARIFDPFFSTKFTGRGLGLAAAMGIVRSHGGSMKVYSTPGEGSVFKVLLPASDSVVRLRQQKEQQSPTGRGLILVVDDEPMICELAQATLTELGYAVITAADGLQAVEMFRQRGTEIDCVLLDMTMPNLDGEGTFKILRDQRADLPIILSSGYNEIAATRRFIGRGIAGFLQKPYTAVDLAKKIGDVLAST